MAEEIIKEDTVVVEPPVKGKKAEREVSCVFVSDGVYKYVYKDTGEDVV